MLNIVSLIIVIGAIRGDPGDNRFGPPPTFGLKRPPARP